MTEIKRFGFTPILGWSATRYNQFSICKRRYFYQYYAKYDPSLPVREIETLKELVSIPLEIGTLVHKVIEVLLNRLRSTAEPIHEAKFFDFATRQTTRHSATQRFQEVAYGELDSVEPETLLPKVQVCLENLLESDRFRWLVEEAVHASGDWVIDPPGYGETRLQDMKAYFKVDFLFPVQETYHIIDWKTGQEDPEKHRKQLLGYSAWTSYHFGVDPEHVEPAVAYLYPEYKEVQERFNEFDLENFSVQVRAETREMYEYCRDVDQNIPVEKEEFRMVEHEAICSRCKFRALCYPDQYPLVAR